MNLKYKKHDELGHFNLTKDEWAEIIENEETMYFFKSMSDEEYLISLKSVLDIYNYKEEQLTRKTYIRLLKENINKNVLLQDELHKEDYKIFQFRMERDEFDFYDEEYNDHEIELQEEYSSVIVPLLADNNNLKSNIKLFKSLGVCLPNEEVLMKPYEEILAIVRHLHQTDQETIYSNLEEVILYMYESSTVCFKNTNNKTLSKEFLEENGVIRIRPNTYTIDNSIDIERGYTKKYH